MRIAVVHLSDIHFQVHSNPIISRAEKIVAALRPVLQDVGGVVFAVTGDVAFSGMKEEYEVASGFLISLRDATTQTDPHMPIEFVFIPGNHDCNFRSEGDARPALREGVAAKMDALDPSGEIVCQVTNVQDEFFAFEAALRAQPEIPKSDRLRFGSVNFLLCLTATTLPGCPEKMRSRGRYYFRRSCSLLKRQAAMLRRI